MGNTNGALHQIRKNGQKITESLEEAKAGIKETKQIQSDLQKLTKMFRVK